MRIRARSTTGVPYRWVKEILVAVLVSGGMLTTFAGPAAAKTGKMHSPLCQQPAQHVTAPAGVFGIVAAIDKACAWTESLDGLRAAETRAKDAHIHWIAYDLERWAASGSDRADPIASIIRLGHRAHADGFKVLMTPWIDWPHAKFAAVVKAAARAGDILDLQIEGYGCYPGTFGSLAKEASGIVQGTHQQPILVNQVTGFGCTGYLRAGWRAARSWATGRWVWSG